MIITDKKYPQLGGALSIWQFLNDKFRAVLAHEGVVTVLSWGATAEPHLVNTWNSYLEIVDGDRILIPAFGYRQTEKNVAVNPEGTAFCRFKEVEGYNGYEGYRFYRREGTARFLSEGPEFDLMKKKLDFPNRVMEITVTKATQKI